MSFLMNDAELDMDLLLSRPVESQIATRAERKAAAAAAGVKTPSRLNSSKGSKTPSRSKTPGSYADRFIPSRDSMNAGLALHNLTNNENSAPAADKQAAEFNSKLAQSLFAGEDLNTKILAFKNKAPAPSADFTNKMRVVYTSNKEKEAAAGAAAKRAAQRVISSTPERILDAPDMLDDYYLNLLEWGPNNQLAVGLGSCVYLWDAGTGKIELLAEAKDEDDHVCSVSWMEDGSHLAIGTTSCDTQLWNVERKTKVRSMKSHTARVSALAWNKHILSSAGRDSTIQHHDVRVQQHLLATLRGHEQEVCGLKWSPDGSQLASGSNDNTCMIWDVNTTSAAAPEHKYRFNDACAAVKALAWCPWQKGLLATGAGTADRNIRFYNTLNGTLVNSIDTKSQVCSLVWSKEEKEILSAHGFSQNQLTVWKYPTLVKVAELTGHQSRVLHTALSPDGAVVCSGAADETLRFWRVWEGAGKKKTAAKSLDESASSATAGAARSRLAINIR